MPPDDRVAAGETERDDRGARADAERHESLQAGMEPVGDEGRAVEAAPHTKPDARRHLAAHEADRARDCKHRQLREVRRVE